MNNRQLSQAQAHLATNMVAGEANLVADTLLFDPHPSVMKFIIPMTDFTAGRPIPPGFLLVYLGKAVAYEWGALYLGKRAMEAFKRLAMFRNVTSLSLAQKHEVAAPASMDLLEATHQSIMEAEAARTNTPDHGSLPLALATKADWLAFMAGETATFFHRDEPVEQEEPAPTPQSSTVEREAAARAEYQLALRTPLVPSWESFTAAGVNRHLIKLNVPPPQVPLIFCNQDPVGMGRKFLEAVRSLSYWAFQLPELVDKVTPFQANLRFTM